MHSHESGDGHGLTTLAWAFFGQNSEDLGGDLRWSEPFDSVQVVVVLDRGGVAGSLWGEYTLTRWWQLKYKYVLFSPRELGK